MSELEPRLYANASNEDGIAIQLLAEAGVPYINLGPVFGEETPFLEYGYWRFQGIRGIQEFVQKWKAHNLPPLDMFK